VDRHASVRQTWLLDGHVEGYESKTKYRSGHSLDNVHEVLTDLRPPPDAPAVSGMSAYDVFCGYLVLDALVANSDRHDHNWAVFLRPTLQDERPALAASYDHASSLGFNLRDERRDRFVAEGTVSRFAGRGVARRFEHASPPTSNETLAGLARRVLLRATADKLGRGTVWRGEIADCLHQESRLRRPAAPQASFSRLFGPRNADTGERALITACVTGEFDVSSASDRAGAAVLAGSGG